MAESRNTASCSSNQRKKTLSTQDVIDAIFEESSSSDEGESFCNREEVPRTFASNSEPCFRESILHRDLKLQSNNKFESDGRDDASDNDNPLDNSGSQSLSPRK